MLDINGLSIRYGSVEVVHGVTMHVEEGKIVALIGPNGAGKSSVLRAVSGLVQPSSGDIVFLGASLAGALPHEIAAAGIAHVMEGRHLFGGLTVEDNLLLAGASDASGSAGNMEAVLQRWPILAQRRHQLAGNLSGGEQQMLAIGRALISRPRLIMLDEPSCGLAPKVVRDLMQTILDVRSEGMTVLLVEQMANLALKICDYGYVMSNGKIVMEGTGQSLLSNPDLQVSYLGGEVSAGKPGEGVIPIAPKAKLEWTEAPQAPGEMDYRAKEMARQEKEATKRKVVSPAPMPPMVHPGAERLDLREGMFEDRERLRQAREKSFVSKDTMAELKEELGRIRKEISSLKESRMPTEEKAPPAPREEWREFERQRQEKQAQRTAKPGASAKEEGLIRGEGTDRREREFTRSQREASFMRSPQERPEGRGSDYEEREKERRKRQEEMRSKAGSSPPHETSFTPSPRGPVDRKAFEVRRAEKERLVSEARGTPLLESSGKKEIDRRAQELAREQRQAARQRKQKEQAPES